MSSSPNFEKLLATVKAAWDKMTPDEQEAMLKAQRESWVRGELAMGETSVIMQPKHCRHGTPITLHCEKCSTETQLKTILKWSDGTERKEYYGEGEQPWDVGVRLGWAHGFAALNVLKYLRRVKPGQEAHSRESAKVYWRWLDDLASGRKPYGWFDEAGIARLQLIGSLTPEELAFLEQE